MFRLDRIYGRGQGVMLYGLDNTVCNQNYNLESSTTIYNEIMVCDIELSAVNKIALIVFYRLPSENQEFNINLQYVQDKQSEGYKKNAMW